MLRFKTKFEQKEYTNKKMEKVMQLHSMTEVMKHLKENPTQRDMLLKLGGLSQRYNVLHELAYTSHFKQLLTHVTILLVQEFNRCLSDGACDADDVADKDWHSELTQVTYCSTSSVLRTEELDEAIKKAKTNEDNTHKKTLKVKVLNIDWMVKDKKNFLQLAKILQGCPDNLYESLFIKKIFDEFWPKWQFIIIKR